MKRYLLILLTICLCFVCITVSAEGTPQNVLDARNSITYIEVYSANDVLLGSGTGFAIGSQNEPVQYIVTNHHVSGDAHTRNLIYFGSYDSLPASVVFTLPENDLRLLKLETSTSQLQPLPLSTRNFSSLTGDSIYALGFPGSAIDLFSFSDSTINDVTITDGMIGAARQAPYIENGPIVSMLQINAALSPGNSGGPLLDSSGCVLGINTFGSATDTNMNGAIHISELIYHLEKQSIPFMSQAENTKPTGFILLIAAGAVLLIVILVLIPQFIRFLRIKNSPTFDQFCRNHKCLTLDMALLILDPVFQHIWQQEDDQKPIILINEKNIRFAQNGFAFYTPSKESSTIISPEELQGAALGSWTSVYHIGAILYLALIGTVLPHPLSRYQDDTEVQENILSTPIPEILQKALALKPNDRMITAKELFESLSLLKKQPFAKQHTIINRKKKSISKEKKRLIAVAVCLSFLFVAVAGVFVYTISAVNHAQNYLQQQQFSAASEAISYLPDFLHTELASIRQLAHCGELYYNKEYEAALEGLSVLGDYSISAELKQKCQDEIKKAEYASLMEKISTALSTQDFASAKDMLLEYQYGSTTVGDTSVYIITKEEFNQSQYDYAELLYSFEYYTKALEVFESIMNYKDSTDRFVSSVISHATVLTEKGNLLNAYIFLSPHKNKHDIIKEAYDVTVSAVYKEAKAYLNQNNEQLALSYFNQIKTYKDSSSYINLITSENVFYLINHLEYGFVKKKVYTHENMQKFLEGKWTNDRYYFQMKSDGSITYDLPWFDYGDYYTITEGVCYLFPKNKETERRALFKFTIQSRDVISVYSYKSGGTYRLVRE